MKSIYKIVLITLALFALSGFTYSQTLLVTEGFENGTGLGEGTSYRSNQFQNGDANASPNDFWARTNVSPMAGSSNNQTYTGWTGTYHWNGEDIDDNGNPLGSGNNGYVVLKTLDISSYAGGTGTVSLQLAADRNGNGGWETSDGIFIEYAFDTDVATGANSVGGLPSSVANVSSGTYTIAGAFYGSGLTSPNNYLFEDTDLNGSGDGSQLTNTATTYSFNFSIPSGKSNMSIRIRAATNQGGEILAFDEIKVYGTTGGAPAPSVSITSNNSVSCPGGSNGSLTATVTGGTANYSYTWSNFSSTNNTASTTNTISSLAATTYTVTVTDNNGLTATSSATVSTTADNTAPVITVCASTPSNISANGSCQGTAPNLTGSVTATDNCTASPTITQSPASGATLGLGTTTITLTATDGSGNTATCTVNQTVVDNTAPTITVCASTPSNIPANGSCQATAPNLTGSVTATDNCTASPTITQSPSSGATLGLGTTTITLTATDGSGNTATCTVNQTVIDNTAPVITVCASTPSNIPAGASCTGTAPNLTGSVTATDNCTASPTITQSPASGATLGLGTTTITLTATDGSGNTATCTVNQTVVDNTAPTITVCASTPSNISASGSCTGTAPNLTGSVTATDNCTASPTITQSPASGATLGLGTTTITLTATDGSGNTATCTVNQTVVDNTAPTITVCASTPSNIPAGASCTGTAPNLTGSVTATDNCTASPTITQSPASGATLGLGTTTITLTATDGSGNTATCTVNQTVVDNTSPVITVCASTPSNISANGSCQGTAPNLTGSVTATDNCTASPTITQSPASGATLGLGTTTITLTATDGSGNTATCTVNQTVVDNTAPTITVCASTPSNISANGSCTGTAPNLTGSVTATDNCTASPTITQSPASGATLGLGTTTITLTATDGSGNTATCTVNQTVVDNTAPTITVCASTPSNISANGSCTGTAPNLTGSVTATDNCTASPTITQSPASGATLGLGTTTITLTATDGSGNTATCTVNQTVVDNTAPTITVCASTPSNISANGSCQGTAPDLTGSVTANDNCTGSPTITQSPASGATLGLGTTTITLTATDGSGNTATCTVNQTVIDNTAPTITVCASTPSNLIGNSSDQAPAPDLTGSVTATDNCTGSPTITQSPTSGTTLGLGTTTITLTATDGSGNTATCTVNQTVVSGYSATISAQTNVSCNGLADGSATAAPSGGTTPYTYAWSTGANTATATGLAAGTYTVTITEGGTNTATTTVTITQPNAIVASISIDSNVSCNGYSDGGATASAIGGTGSYTYVWNNAATNASITGVIADAYTVTITDANGCTATTTSNISEPAVLVATVVIDSNASCNGYANGGATASASGGTMAYNYLWSNAATNASITGVIAGNYTVTITDANGCTATNNNMVSEPTSLVASASPANNVSCNGLSDAAAQVTATGGTGSYTYVWNNGTTSDMTVNIPAGTYSVTITDQNGCTDSSSTTITEPAALVAAVVIDSNVTCNGFSNGGATSSGSGGTMPYSYFWNNTSTNASITGVTAATYTITITDANGCTASSNGTITEPVILIAATVVDSNVSCNGLSDGGASAAATGGTMPYSYAWSNSATNASITGVVAGTYTVTITDANGCTSTSVVSITQPAALVAATVVDSNISCNGLADGGASASATGGTMPYTYAWSNGANVASISSLAAGTYSVTVTDANGCTSTSSSTVTEPAALVATSVVDSNVSCNGLSDGGASASASGGTMPYSYAWSNGATTASITGLAAGTYSVTITDANGCMDITLSTVTEPVLLVASTVVDSNVTCHSGTNGGVTASATGGTGAYSYAWSNGATTASITGVAAGNYTVTVTDANGCTSSASTPVTQPTALIAVTVVDSNITCNGLSNGGASASASGGTGAYSYAWNNAAITASITGVAAGTYSVTVTDANGCTDSTSVIITEPAALVASAVVDNNVSCNGLADGSATASATGGTGAYSYTWSTGATTATVTGLAAGTYSVTVVDANGCSANTSVTISEPAALVVSTTVVSNVSCNGLCDGEISANVTGGTSPASFIWSTGSTGNPITNLCAGTYTVTVTDANGCTATSTSIVTEPPVLVASTSLDANVSCNGLADGAATATATGGTPSHTFLWNTGAATASVTGLTAGTYTVTVTDANSCTSTASLVITEPALLVAATVVDANVTCFAGNDGGLTASASGGTTTYSYLWNTGATNASISGLSAGTYSVTVTDANGCTDSTSATVTEPPLVSVDLGNDTSVCFGGSLTLDAGAGFASYLWQDNSTNQTYSVNTATPGVADYSVTVTNSNGCIGFDTINVTVFQATGVTISGANNLCAYDMDTLVASTGFVSYIWNTSATTSQIIVDANSLSPGNQNYAVTATDSNGCVSDDAVSFNVYNPVVVDLGPDTSIVWVDGSSDTYTLDAGAGFSSYLWSDLTTTSQTYDVTLANMGTIFVVVTDGNGCLGVDTVFVDFILDVPTLNKASVNIYPNPAADYLNIDMEGFNGQQVQVIITDMGGKQVINNTLKVNGSQTSTLDVSSLPTGTYFIQIQTEDQNVVKHIVIR